MAWIGFCFDVGSFSKGDKMCCNVYIFNRIFSMILGADDHL